MRRAYLAPHPTWASRTGVLAFPRQIPAGPDGRAADFLGTVEDGMAQFRDRPVQIVWAMRDVAFGPDALDRWRETFPDAEVLRLTDAGHFLEEDAHAEVVPALLRLIDRVP